MSKCKITDIKKEKDSILVEVEGCDLRTAGGGQPSDRGILIKNGQKADIIEVVKENEKKLLKINKNPDLKKGESVEYLLDEAYRYTLSRMHTGEHTLSRALELTIPGLKIEKAELGEHMSTIFVSTPRELDWEILFEAERLANKIIEENRKVNIRIVNREEAQNIAGLRIKWDRINSDMVRIVEIEGYDAIACSGTHTKHTGEVGKLMITRFSGGKGNYDIKFVLNAETRLWEYSYRLRKLETKVNMEVEQLHQLYEKIKKENKQLQKEIKTISNYISFPEEKLIINELPFYIIYLKNFPSPAISIYLSRMYKQREKNYIIINETNTETNICLSLPLLADEKAQALVDYITKSIDAKGGGRGIYRLSIKGIKKEILLEKLKEFKI